MKKAGKETKAFQKYEEVQNKNTDAVAFTAYGSWMRRGQLLHLVLSKLLQLTVAKFRLLFNAANSVTFVSCRNVWTERVRNSRSGKNLTSQLQRRL